MIIRLNGGQCVQVIQQFDKAKGITVYRARLSDSQGRSQSEFTEWTENFDDAVSAAKQMPKTERGKLNNSK